MSGFEWNNLAFWTVLKQIVKLGEVDGDNFTSEKFFTNGSKKDENLMEAGTRGIPQNFLF